MSIVAMKTAAVPGHPQEQIERKASAARRRLRGSRLRSVFQLFQCSTLRSNACCERTQQVSPGCIDAIAVITVATSNRVDRGVLNG
jgi:hypothetical protein